MDDSLDKEIHRFREEIADDLVYRRKGQTTWRPKLSLPFKLRRSYLFLGGAVILLLIVFIALFSGNGNESLANNLLVIRTRLDLLEKRIKHLEGMEGKLVVTETAKTEGPLADQLQNLTKRLDRLEQKMVPVPATAQAPLTRQEEPSPLTNGRYHEVRSGDTLYKIASTYGITIDELCRLNNISPRQIIYPGQRLLVAPEARQ